MNGMQLLIWASERVPRVYYYGRAQSFALLHLASATLIVLCSFAFPLIALFIIRQKISLKPAGMPVVLAACIIVGGITGLLEKGAIWHPADWLSGGIQALTALAFISTVALFLKSASKPLTLSSATDGAATNEKLQQAERRKQELELALATSEARFRHIFESVPVSLWIIDRSEMLRVLERFRVEASGDWAGWLTAHPALVEEAFGALKVKDVNSATLRVFGAKQKEEISRSLKSIFATAEARRDFIAGLCTSERGGTDGEHQITLNSIEGSPMSLSQTATLPHLRSGGEALLSLIDMTAVRRIEQERDQFFELSHDLLSIGDPTGCYSRLNPAWEKTLGYSRGELLGRCGGDLVHPDDITIAQRVKEDVLKGIAAQSFELRLRCKDGSYRWVLGNAVSDHDKRLIYFSGRDITTRKSNEQEIQNLNTALRGRAEELERMNGEMESFSYSVSHDLRAPLRHISSFAKILAEDQGSSLDANGLRYIGIISTAAKQMGQLIDDVLRFSSTSRATISLGEVDNERLVAEIVQTGHYDTPERSIEWKIDPLGTVQADASMLRQVWTNLIENAVKYSSKEAHPQIIITRSIDPGLREHVFSVRDNGVGFDMELAGKLFSPFQRLHRSAEFEGSGIGLANVRRIVGRHGGRAWAVGKVGEGATIYFSLPYGPLASCTPFSASPSTTPLNSLPEDRRLSPRGPQRSPSEQLGVSSDESTFAFNETEPAPLAALHAPSIR